ncbi:putative protein N(5)-glutamine methyltransferase [Glaciihabitans arcticus]|uniref:peptide chain release factor N(5)-glutamine methyltransferase n=1 Tax=Glaciihabitans arcticus TaxID=2668039 RepID=A0A4Q9GQ12_9MICO|nr:putative protein N(5)-glutamine methyltransferase [Glaciihabitans arcticus]TBN56916.1 putative protein N(5)-glutamine methyltransferase [Glaciihabitans arcticus]
MSLIERLRAAGCVYAEDEAALLEEAATGDALEALVLRRIQGEPLEVVLGWAEFRGLRIAVDAGVFVPRKRTEVLVELGVRVAGEGARILDLCCGTGAVGAAMLAERPDVTVWGAELDPAAAACARRNLPAVFEGDLFAPLPHGVRFDLLLVNAPYVPTEAIALMPPEARLYEPRIALDGGSDGLDLHRRVAAEASGWLSPGGTVIIETSEEQAAHTAAAFAAHGFATRIEHSDELDGTAVVATSS